MEDEKWMHEGMQTRRSMLSWMEGRNEMIVRVFGLWTKALQMKNLGFKEKTCPTPVKIAYKSMAKARQAAIVFNRNRREGGKFLPYQCRCGKAHLTTHG